MKKISMLFAALAVTCAAHAQFSLSGSFGLYGNTNKTRIENDGEFTDTRKNGGDKGFAFSPAIGYSFGDCYEAGLILSVSRETETTRIMSDLYDEHTFGFESALYCRRYFDLTDRLSFFAEAQGFWNIEKGTVDDYDGFSRETNIGISVIPGLSYSLGEHWSVESYFGFAGLEWNNNYTADFDEDKKVSGNGTYKSSFNFGGTSELESVLDLLGSVSIGLCYEF